MADISKDTFMSIVRDIVAGFEDPDFKQSFAAAKAASDVPAMMQLPLEIQSRAFGAHGLDPTAGTEAFKAAGRQYASDPEVAALLTRMKAAL